MHHLQEERSKLQSEANLKHRHSTSLPGNISIKAERSTTQKIKMGLRSQKEEEAITMKRCTELVQRSRMRSETYLETKLQQINGQIEQLMRNRQHHLIESLYPQIKMRDQFFTKSNFDLYKEQRANELMINQKNLIIQSKLGKCSAVQYKQNFKPRFDLKRRPFLINKHNRALSDGSIFLNASPSGLNQPEGDYNSNPYELEQPANPKSQIEVRNIFQCQINQADGNSTLQTISAYSKKRSSLRKKETKTKLH